MVKQKTKATKVFIIYISLVVLIIAVVAVIEIRDEILWRQEIAKMGKPGHELIESIVSPDNRHTMDIYLYNGGATMDWSTIIYIVDNTSGNERELYFQYHEKEPNEAVWIDSQTVRINGMELDIEQDKYDSRMRLQE